MSRAGDAFLGLPSVAVLPEAQAQRTTRRHELPLRAE
jgi:hypothetical protein